MFGKAILTRAKFEVRTHANDSLFSKRGTLRMSMSRERCLGI